MGKKERPIAIGKLADNIIPEFLLAILIAGGVSLAAFSNLLFMEEGLYNVTADGMGHLTKVVYLAESWKNLEFPSWCPFWYNGSTIAQYYAPLGYWMMAIAQIFTGDVMLTMKIYCFVSLFFGSLGVWAICRKYIGNWCGLFGIVVYGLQPYLSLTLLGGGALAQGSIYLFTPWLLLLVIGFFYQHSRNGFIGIVLLTAVLILGHAMHAFMICLSIALVGLPYVFTKKISWMSYVLTGFAMGVGALLCSFWWLVGVTSFETPGIPYLLEEATVIYSARIEWFLSTGIKTGIRFGFSAVIISIIGGFIYRLTWGKKWSGTFPQFAVSFNIYLTVFTVIFSFGQNLGILEYFPFIEVLVPGRVLSLTAASSGIVASYLIFQVSKKDLYGIELMKGLGVVFPVLLISLVIWDMNPYRIQYGTEFYSNHYNQTMPTEVKNIGSYDKGRYTWVAPINCAEAFFPVVEYNFNTADGWNIEGTPHNRTLWSHNIALVSRGEEYTIKNLLFWNVRWIYTLQERQSFIETLNRQGFEVAKEADISGSKVVTLVNSAPSSYFLTDPRDVLVVGPGANGIALEFPFMVHEFETDIMKFDLNELLKYRVIYIAEPELKGTSKILAFEKRVEDLVNQGVYVIVELSRMQRLPVFDVSCKELQETQGVILTGGVNRSFEIPFSSEATQRDVTFFGLSGLDMAYFSLYSSPEHKMGDVVGEKKVGKGSVVMIGSRLTQYLKAPTLYMYGHDPSRQFYVAENIKEVLYDMLEKEGFQHSFVPEPFSVDSADWDYQGVVFSYNVPEPEEVTVSVTYTPRWKAKVDGEKWPVKSRESLRVMDLPAGTHEVELHYGMTVFGVIGYGLSLMGVILLVYAHRRYSTMVRFIRYLGKRLVRFFQFPSKQWKNGS